MAVRVQVPPRVRIDKTSASALVFRFGNLAKLVCAYVDKTKTKPLVLVLSSPRLNRTRQRQFPPRVQRENPDALVRVFLWNVVT